MLAQVWVDLCRQIRSKKRAWILCASLVPNPLPSWARFAYLSHLLPASFNPLPALPALFHSLYILCSFIAPLLHVWNLWHALRRIGPFVHHTTVKPGNLCLSCLTQKVCDNQQVSKSYSELFRKMVSLFACIWDWSNAIPRTEGFSFYLSKSHRLAHPTLSLKGAKDDGFLHYWVMNHKFENYRPTHF